MFEAYKNNNENVTIRIVKMKELTLASKRYSNYLF